jgi:hypothetical protein
VVYLKRNITLVRGSFRSTLSLFDEVKYLPVFCPDKECGSHREYAKRTTHSAPQTLNLKNASCVI